MTTVNTDNYQRYSDGKKGYPGFAGFEKISILESYEAVALVTGSTINMFVPPRGAIYVGGKLAWDDLGSGVTLAVGVGAAADGTAADTTKFLGATDAASAADEAALDAGAAEISVLGYEFDGVTPVIITTGGGTGTGSIKLLMDLLLP